MVDYASALVDVSDTPTILEYIKESRGELSCDNDYKLTADINAAFRILEAHLDNKLVSQEVTERFKARRDRFALRYWPADNVTSVLVDGAESVLEYEPYYQDGLTWLKRGDCHWPDNFVQVDVTYTAGFDPVPVDIVYAVRDFATQIGAIAAPGTIKKESVVGVGSIEYATSESASGSIIPDSIMSILSHYRRLHV